MPKGSDLPSWATKGAGKNARQAKQDPSLPSWAGSKPRQAPAAGGGAVVVASSGGEHQPGFFHRFAGDFKDIATHAIGGVEAAGTTAGKTFYYDARYGPTSKEATGQRKKLAHLEGGVLASTADTVRHPLRHPGDSFITALGILSGGAGLVARGAEAGRVVRAAEGASKTEKAGRAAKALATRPSQGVRTFTHKGQVAVTSGSRNALIRAAQKKVLDPLRHQFPDAPVIGSAATVGRLGRKADRYAKRQTDAEAGLFFRHAKAAGMLKRGKNGKVSADALARQHAMRVVAEGVPLEHRVQTHEDYLNRGYNASAKTDPEIAAMRGENFTKGHQEQLALNEAAAKYVHTVNGVPRFKPEHKDLIEAYEQAKHLGGSREAVLERVGKLADVSKEGRYSAPGNEFFGMAKRGPDTPTFSPLTLFHGSPEGQVGTVDALHHTKPWREGPGFYLTTDYGKAGKYAAGKTASAERRSGAGAVNPYQLKPGAKVLDLDKATPDYWREMAGQIIGEPVDEKTWSTWARDIQDKDVPGGSPGIVNRMRLLHLLTGYDEMPKTDAYYAIEEALHARGVQATLHHEAGVPVYVVKDENAIQRTAATGTKPGEVIPFTGGELRVPTVPKGKMPRSKADLPQVGAQGVVNGVPKEIASIYKPYLGKAYKAGAIRTDVVRLMHETWQEAQRYTTLLHTTDRLKASATDFKTSKHDILIKTDELPGGLPMKDAKELVDDTHSDPSKLAELAYRYESVREQMFPDRVGGASKGSPLGETAPPGYKWIDSRTLGGLNHRNPLLGFYDNKTVMGAIKVTDAINNASKMAILYMKPAYIASNVAGNAFMVLTHQGFAAPANLKRAAFLNAEADAATVAKVDSAIGEGVSGVLDTGNQGITGKVVHAAAGVASKFVDLIPRRAAFLHEASKEGFKGSNLHELFAPQNAEKLHLVTERMNHAMIDYGDLGPFEQAIVRRLIFFYPWVKGATKWTVRYVPEHPIQAAAGAAFAQQGKQNQQDALGSSLPSWAEGLIPGPAGKTTNPSSIGILNTPVDLAKSVVGGTVSDNLPPGVGLATGYRHPVRAVEDQARSLPTVPVADVALHALGVNSHLAKPSKTFPQERTPSEALLLWLLGSGFAPRVTDRGALERSAYFQKHPPHG